MQTKKIYIKMREKVMNKTLILIRTFQDHPIEELAFVLWAYRTSKRGRKAQESLKGLPIQ